MALPQGHKFNIGLYRGKHGKIFLSETISSRTLIFGMFYDLVDLYQVCSNDAPGAKIGPPQVSPGTRPAFNRYLYVSFKQNSGERFRATWPSCLTIIMYILYWILQTVLPQKRGEP